MNKKTLSKQFKRKSKIKTALQASLLAFSSASMAAPSIGDAPNEILGKTKYSHDLERATKMVEAYNPDMKVHYIDVDKMAKMSANSKIKSVPNLTSRQIYNETGIIPPASVISGLAQRLQQEEAAAYPVHFNFNELVAYSPNHEKGCFITLHSANISQESIISTLFFGTQFMELSLNVLFEPDELREQVRMHEGWHCIDTKYQNKTLDPSTPYQKHKQESFSDAGAIMEMALLGYKDTARKTALLRQVASFKTGSMMAKALKQKPKNDSPFEFVVPKEHEEQEKNKKYGAAIYNTANSIIAMDTYIKKVGLEKIKSLNHSERIELVYNLVEETCMSEQEFESLHKYHEDALTYMQELRWQAYINSQGRDLETIGKIKFLERYEQISLQAEKTLLNSALPQHSTASTKWNKQWNIVQKALNDLETPETERTDEQKTRIYDFEMTRYDLYKEMVQKAKWFGQDNESNRQEALAQMLDTRRNKLDQRGSDKTKYEDELGFIEQLIMHNFSSITLSDPEPPKLIQKKQGSHNPWQIPSKTPRQYIYPSW